MDLFKEINKSFLEAKTSKKEEKVNKNLEEKMQEHNALQKELAVMSTITKSIGNRIKELGDEMMPIIKEMDGQMKEVNGAILTFKEKKGKGVKYKEAFTKALEVVDKKQQKVLNEFLVSVTTTSTTDTLNIADPDLANFLKELKSTSDEDLIAKVGQLSKLPKQIAAKKRRDAAKATKESLQEDIIEKAKAAVKKLVNIFKMMFSRVEKKVDDSAKAVDDLVRAVGDGTVNESRLNEALGLLGKHLDVTLRKKYDLTDGQVENMENAIEAAAGDMAENIADAHNAASKEDKMSAREILEVANDIEDFIMKKIG